MKMEINGTGSSNMKKIYYINELGYPDGYHQFDVHRLPQAYMDYLKWYSLSYDSILTTSIESDAILIFQTPANDELRKLNIIKQFVNLHVTFITQESSIFDWFDWPAAEQEAYIDVLSRCTGFLYHSDHDRDVMKIFCNNFIKYPGCTNLAIDEHKQYGHGEYIVLPNPIKRFQRGMIVHKIASNYIDNSIPVYSMKYNAPTGYQLSFPDAYSLSPIKICNRMDKEQWLQFIYSSKFGIDINRDFSGGNCCLEFASLATPLIGNIHLDTQRDIFPDLSFEYNDYDNIQKTINLLLYDKDFYEEVSKKALNNVKTLYNSKNITSKFISDVYKLLEK